MPCVSISLGLGHADMACSPWHVSAVDGRASEMASVLRPPRTCTWMDHGREAAALRSLALSHRDSEGSPYAVAGNTYGRTLSP